MSITKTRPEVLAPAGTLEKLKVAIDYGADAVYIGGQAYGLRSRAGNFTFEEMAEGVAYASAHNAKVYVAANMVTHEGNEKDKDVRIGRRRTGLPVGGSTRRRGTIGRGTDGRSDRPGGAPAICGVAACAGAYRRAERCDRIDH